MWRVTADPQRFEEAEEWFRNRVPVTPSEYRALSDAARRRAWSVAGAAQLSLVSEVHDALQQAIEEGRDFAAFRKEVGEKLEAAWGGSVKQPGHRLETVYRTNVQGAYSAGRWKQQTDPDVLRARPYWLYDAVLDSRTSVVCRNLHGTLLPASDPFWETRYPPNHFGGCRSGVRSLTRAQALERGLTETPTLQEADVPFRNAPSPDDWVPGFDGYPYELARVFAARVAASPVMDDFLRGQGPNRVPVAALDDELAEAIGSQSRTVTLSEETLAKQRRNHPELPEALYRSVQRVMDDAKLVIQDSDTTLVFIALGDKLLHAALKSTRIGDELYLTSLRYTREEEAERAKRRGKVVRERK